MALTKLGATDVFKKNLNVTEAPADTLTTISGSGELLTITLQDGDSRQVRFRDANDSRLTIDGTDLVATNETVFAFQWDVPTRFESSVEIKPDNNDATVFYVFD